MKRLASTTLPLLAMAWCMAIMPLLAYAASVNELSLNGLQYQHRWSRNGQNEFTPPGETDLSRWNDMLTINVVDKISNGEQLALLANQVLGGYKMAGKVFRTSSVPRTDTTPAEHFVCAVLGQPGFLEAVFARFVLVNGSGLVIVQSHRLYGQDVGPAMSAWLQANGARSEQALMAWRDIPAVDGLRALPQSAR